MIFSAAPCFDTSRAHLHDLTHVDDGALFADLAASVPLSPIQRERIGLQAKNLVQHARDRRHTRGDMADFLAEYGLSTPEGVALMCLAEALLRIPDAETADRLIRDKIGSAHWDRHLRHSPSLLVNASTWALMFGKRMVRDHPIPTAHGLLNRLGEVALRHALTAAMGILGRQFVMGRTIAEALEHSRSWADKGYRHSYDMLGEAARTQAAVQAFLDAYSNAILVIGKESGGQGPISGPGVSVKLSALHPRYEMAQRHRVMAELTPRLIDLCRLAKSVNIGLTVDAEEADRLDLSLDVLTAAMSDPSLLGWDGLGLAVQAYQKRAKPLVGWLIGEARRTGRRLMVRLVKGAYWDSEIKRAQERGLDGFPVFTTKAATDVSYLACAAELLAAGSCIFPQFATHNAHTMAAVAEMAGERSDWEFQRLHGMGEALYQQIVPERPCRTYAPVGQHQELLPYLVRRLLENGANTSFVNRMTDAGLPIETVVADPMAVAISSSPIPLPRDLFAPRRNSTGLDLCNPLHLEQLDAALTRLAPAPILPKTNVSAAVEQARGVFPVWDRLGGEARASILERAADLYETARPDLMRLAIQEAGKTIPDAMAEVREAVDFLRYYAAEARRLCAPMTLPGPVGEINTLALRGRGVFACISPWNFPLAILTGQVAAALAVGNTVVAKPAEQTPLMAAAAVKLMHQAGIPPDVLHLLPGGPEMGRALVSHPAIAGVAFTGSSDAALSIHRILAAKDGPILPLIAETGGLNAMIVDSSALLDQVMGDVLESAFRSSGQRCSALRLLFVQRDVWRQLEPMLVGAVQELTVGDPALLATDVGPVIDHAALEALKAHARRLDACGRLVVQARCPETGLLFAPRIYEIGDMSPLAREVFGPILHVMPWDAPQLDQVIETINAAGYGLTLGVHSRIDHTVNHIVERARTGNIYVNRSMIGAAVGSQPFGGLGLSGTGPKAGGPHTLARYGVEICLSINSAASGGDAALLGGLDK